MKLGGKAGEFGGELRSELLGESRRGDLGGEDREELLKRSSKSMMVVVSTAVGCHCCSGRCVRSDDEAVAKRPGDKEGSSDSLQYFIYALEAI